MKRYLSFGGGIGSTALMLWLIDHKIKFEAVYCYHGADWPETHNHVAIVHENIHAVTILPTLYYGLKLYDYCIEHRIFPSMFQRWCTAHYKGEPMAAYHEKPCIVYIGYTHDEAHRIARMYPTEGEEKEYPLVDERITRPMAIELIKSHGLPVPERSGCYFCPNQNLGRWKLLRTRHPELFCKVEKMENLHREKQKEKGQRPYFLHPSGKPIRDAILADQADLFGERTPCLCEL